MFRKLKIILRQKLLGGYIYKLLREAHNTGFELGTANGIRIGRMQVGDKGLVLGSCAYRDIEKILKDVEF